MLLHYPDGVQAFKQGPNILTNQRHVAVAEAREHLADFLQSGERLPRAYLCFNNVTYW